MWTLEDGIKFIQNLDPIIRTQFSCFTALTGSVLHRGNSNKDLDVIILPLDSSQFNAAKVADYIKFAFPAQVVRAGNAKIEAVDNDDYTREVIKGMYNGKCIDFFIIHEVKPENKN